jgi:hypothetical protein
MSAIEGPHDRCEFKFLLFAIELLPMIANAEAALISVEAPASHAGFSTASRYIHQIVDACPARACHIMGTGLVYMVYTLQFATRNLQ